MLTRKTTGYMPGKVRNPRKQGRKDDRVYSADSGQMDWKVWKVVYRKIHL